jgi:hypothetical protein
MFTSVSLLADQRWGTPTLLHGEVDRATPSEALFSPSRLVILMHELPGLAPVFIFRTLDRVHPEATVLPGVSRSVDLLGATSSRRAASRVRNALIHLGRSRADLGAFANAFWSDLAVVVSGRLAGPRRLPALVRRHSPRPTL